MYRGMKTKLLRKIRKRYYIFINTHNDLISVYDKTTVLPLCNSQLYVSDVVNIILRDMNLLKLIEKHIINQRKRIVKNLYNSSKVKL